MGAQGKVIEALNMLRRYKQEAGDLAQVGPLAALAKLEEAFTEQDTPTLPTYEMVKGGDLKAGDQVLLICMVSGVDEAYEHVVINGFGVPGPWQANDRLWTWGGEYGSGKDDPPNIMKVTW